MFDSSLYQAAKCAKNKNPHVDSEYLVISTSLICAEHHISILFIPVFWLKFGLFSNMAVKCMRPDSSRRLSALLTRRFIHFTAQAPGYEASPSSLCAAAWTQKPSYPSSLRCMCATTTLKSHLSTGEGWTLHKHGNIYCQRRTFLQILKRKRKMLISFHIETVQYS